MEVRSDPEGQLTLEGLENAENLNGWIFETIKPFAIGKTIEIGSGIGNITSFFVKQGFEITATELREEYVNKLKSKFCIYPNCRVVQMDASVADFDVINKSFLGCYDTIYTINVIEHIEDDRGVIRNASSMLRPGGKLIVLVPAYQSLYNKLDLSLGHYRRYSKRQLAVLFEQSGLTVERDFYFNFVGIFGWLISGKLQRNRLIPHQQIKLYNFLVPIFKFFDRLVFNRAGLSVICVGIKRLNI